MAKSLVMNWMHERVIQRPVAVGDSCGTVRLTVVSDILGGSQVGVDHVTGSALSASLKTLTDANAKVLEVPCVRLDEEFSVDLPIRVLKIDVEGYEGQVLAGADRLLQRRCVDFIVMELLEEVAGSRWHETLKQVGKIIDYGYAVSVRSRQKEKH